MVQCAAVAEKRLSGLLGRLKAVIRCEDLLVLQELSARTRKPCQLRLKKPEPIRFPFRCINNAFLVHPTPVIEKRIPLAAGVQCLRQHNTNQH